MNREEIGKRLRAVRAHLNMTQAAMASEIGISLYALREIEDGKQPLTIEVISALENKGFNRLYFFEYNAAMVQ